jgi:ectoine utilization protein EutC
MQQEVKILTEADLMQIVTLDHDAISVVEDAFAALAHNRVTMPAILSMALPKMNAEVDIKTAYIEGFDGFAIKVSPGFFNNSALGLPSLNGLMMLLDSATGLARAVLLDNGYLTNIRTAAAGGVAAKHLAPTNTSTATVFGAGLQAQLQIKAAHLVTPLNKIFICARDLSKAEIWARKLSKDLKIEVNASLDPQSAVQQSQLVITTTPAEEPIFLADWLHPGLHITAMGSDQETKNEIEADAITQCDLYVADRLSQCEVLGELRSVQAQGLKLKADPVELGQVLCQQRLGRTDDMQITLCDLTGTGAQDTAIATYAIARAEIAGLGHLIQTTGAGN